MKKLGYMVLILLLFTALCGCGQGQIVESDYYIYYINKYNTQIVPVAYEVQAQDDEALINDLILKLSQNPGSVDYRRPLTGQVEINSWNLDNQQLQLTFSSDYSQMDNISEVLCRAAVVRTLIQVESVDYISFYVGDAPLMDKNGNPVGLMTAESFIENPGEQINSIQTATLTLYFADLQGDDLVMETQECHYNSNISLEKLVMERLMKAPIGVEGQSAIPSGTKLVGIYVLNGVCFVNLDEGFLNQNYEIDEEIVMYSMVNSLVELPTVNKVQISVNGDTSLVYRERCSLSTVYERNLDYVSASEPDGTEPVLDGENHENDSQTEEGGE